MNQQNNSSQHNTSLPSFKEEWIKTGLDKDAIKFCEKHAEQLSKEKVTTTQLRNVFSEIKRIKARNLKSSESNKKQDFNEKQSFLLLLPKVAYATARDSKLDHFKKEIFIKAWDSVFDNDNPQVKRFLNFCDLIEGVLAFHKEPKNKN